MKIERISCQVAAEKISEKICQVVDIRDPQSFAQGHIPGSQHLSDRNLDQFLHSADPDAPTLVVCYHGNSSQNAAAFLAERDFTEVYSVDGGFSHWGQLFPERIERG
ncbi:MAG: thiosulfate sulfurtransferase GlpE [Cellvibrionaceae bacterium]|nr:thiosulfate sulfurtransferase GlpE [Cellvibrionaceae bacterium]MCV6627726.1 thiosulfate sulfurtransferase GlpE [Cellvibrionaceae bacterium]